MSEATEAVPAPIWVGYTLQDEMDGLQAVVEAAREVVRCIGEDTRTQSHGGTDVGCLAALKAAITRLDAQRRLATTRADATGAAMQGGTAAPGLIRGQSCDQSNRQKVVK